MWPVLSVRILVGDTRKPQVFAGNHSKEFGFLLGGKPRESPQLCPEHQGAKRIPFPPWASSSKTFNEVS